MNEVAAPVVGALTKDNEEMKEKIKNEVQQNSQQYQSAKGLELNFSAWVISGSK